MLRSYLETEQRGREHDYPLNGESAAKNEKIKVRIRLDYRGLPRPARFFFGGRGSKDVAEEMRQKHASLWRNIPLQGVRIDDIEYLELYTVYDEREETRITYAPIELKLTVDSLEECVRFICRGEFRRIEFLEPLQVSLNNYTLERLFYQFGIKFQEHLQEQLEK